MHIALYIKAPEITFAVLDFVGIATMNLMIVQVVTKRYFKSLHTLGITFMSLDKFSIME